MPLRIFLRMAYSLSTQLNTLFSPPMAEVIQMFPTATPARQKAARENGKKGGQPLGVGHVDKRTLESPEQAGDFIDTITQKLVTGKPVARMSPTLKAPTEDDARAVARFTGISAEEFQARLTDNLRAIADETTERIAQKLQADAFKPNELTFLLAVTCDKLERANGRAAVQNASVNVQINNFGPSSKEEVIARLTGQVLDLGKQAVESVKPAQEQVTA
jgi:hypothetical protein